jgi:hypothetical protein
MREIRSLRARWRGWKPAYGSASEPLPNGNREQQIGRAYGATAPVPDPTSQALFQKFSTIQALPSILPIPKAR